MQGLGPLGGVNTPTMSYAVIGDCNVGRPRWGETTGVTERDSIDLRAHNEAPLFVEGCREEESGLRS